MGDIPVGDDGLVRHGVHQTTQPAAQNDAHCGCLGDVRPDVCGGGADLIVKLFHKLSSCMGCCAYCITADGTAPEKSHIL